MEASSRNSHLEYIFLWAKEIFGTKTASSYCTVDKVSLRSQQSSGHEHSPSSVLFNLPYGTAREREREDHGGCAGKTK